MAGTCSICARPDCAAMEEKHFHGESLRAIAKEHPGVTIWSLRRHLKHQTADLEEMTEENSLTPRAGEKLPARIEELIVEAETIARAARRKQNYTAALAAIRTRLSCLEVLGKITGELRPGNGAQEFIPGTVAAAGAAASITLNLNADDPSAIVPVRAKMKPEQFHELLRAIYGLEPQTVN